VFAHRRGPPTRSGTEGIIPGLALRGLTAKPQVSTALTADRFLNRVSQVRILPGAQIKPQVIGLIGPTQVKQDR
jgi:hypothetical protein